MKTCPSCSSLIEDAASFCPSCGAPIDKITVSDDPYVPMRAGIHNAEAPLPSVNSNHAGYGISFGVGNTIEEAFKLWKGSLVPLVLIFLFPMALMFASGIFMAISVPTMALENAMGGGSVWSAIPVTLLIVALFMFLVTIPISCASYAGMFLMLHEQALKGAIGFGVWEAFRRGLRYIWRILGFGFIFTLILIATYLPTIISLLTDFWPLEVIAFLGQFIALFYLMIKLSLSFIIIVVEDRPVIESMKISFNMVKGHGWTILGIGTLLMAMMFGTFMVGWIVFLIPILGQLALLGVNLLIGVFFVCLGFAMYAGIKDLAEVG